MLIGQLADSLDNDQLQQDSYVYSSTEIKTEPKRTNVEMMVGTSFTVSPNNYYAPSVYVAPSLRHNITPKLSLSTGILVEQATLYPMQGQEDLLPMTRAFLYARGDYQLTRQLRVNTTVYKGMSEINQPSDEYAAFRRNINAMEIGFDYKFSDSFSVGFQMRVQNGTNPYYNPIMPFDNSIYGPRYW